MILLATWISIELETSGDLLGKLLAYIWESSFQGAMRFPTLGPSMKILGIVHREQARKKFDPITTQSARSRLPSLLWRAGISTYSWAKVCILVESYVPKRR
jgi:hypothetical protein